MSDRLLTPAAAAAYLGISVGAFYKLRARHRIPNRGLGRSVRVFESDLVQHRPVAIGDADYGLLGRMFARGESIDHLIPGRRRH